MGRMGYDDRQLAAHKKRTRMSAVMIFILAPLTLWASVTLLGSSKYMITSLLVIIYTMVPFFMIYEKRRPKAREIVLLAVMTAITVFAHIAFHLAAVPIGTALVIVAGISMGPEAGFLVGALARFVCNFYQGQGPYTPWQMFCWGLLGFLAGLAFNKVTAERLTLKNENENEKRHAAEGAAFRALAAPVLSVMAALILAYISYLLVPADDTTFFGWRVYAFGAAGLIAGVLLQRKRFPVNSITITVFTFFTTVILYGGIMNMATMFYTVGFSVSFRSLQALYISGLPYDVTHAALASLCMFFIGQPMIKKIERIKVKYGIYR